MSSAKPPVVFLLALWGESYIQTFFHFSLRSLLAPGNIPAMCEDFDCTFLFLTKRSDIEFFKSQSTFSQLQSYCHVEFVEISDLIFDGTYSATLTLGFERGMRSRGKKMCQTYFFFLVSDYIMADGSLNSLKRYLKAGYSGITTGNFLVVEEYISPIFKEKIEANPSGVLSLNSRELLALGFPYMHPVSLGHTVTQSYTHATHANRLFWKVNDQILVGRFYLRHMLCIRPEIEDFIIGSSCDYSYIPEMCPSGNVKHIQDSDDYCVIEMAPYAYEQQWIRPGKFAIEDLANRLSEWTTEVHRANAHLPIIYHSEELKEFPTAAIEESQNYVNEVEKLLSKTPHPVRGHHYWISCMKAVLRWIVEQTDRERYHHRGTFAGIIGSPTFSPLWSQAHDDRDLLKLAPTLRPKIRLKDKLAGISPKTSLWHLQWFDDYHLKKGIEEKLAQKIPSMVIAFEPIPDLIQWLEHDYPDVCTYQYYDLFISRSPSELKTLFQNTQHAFIYLRDTHFCELGAAIRQCVKYLPAGSTISVYLKNKKALPKKQFNKSISICVADLLGLRVFCEEMHAYSNIPRLYLHRPYAYFIQKLFAPKKRFLTRLIGYLGLSAVNALCVIGNLLSLLGLELKRKKTSASITLKCKDYSTNA